jgi:hypothetical protein
MKGTNEVINHIWQACALTGLLAFAIESLLSRFDAQETKALRDELDTTKQMAIQLADKAKDRHLSDTDRNAWKNALSHYPGQQFTIIQIGYGDHEAGRFAKEIGSALIDCGWIGETYIQVVTFHDDHIKIHSGVACFIGHPNPGQTGWPATQAEALGKLLDAMYSSGIKRGDAIAKPFLTIGQIGIIVGPKD